MASMKVKKSVRSPQKNEGPYVVGEQYFIRTVTNYLTGRLTAVYPNEIVLESAAWIADTGRFSDALKNSSVSECEPFINPVIVNRGSVIDATIWSGKLPTEQK